MTNPNTVPPTPVRVCVGLRVPREQRTRWRIAALRRGVPIAALIARAVDDYLTRETHERRQD